MRGIQWPVTFTVGDGRQFTVESPERSCDGAELVMRVRIAGGAGAGDYVLGPTGYPPSTGAVIGRTMRWWIERTGIGITIDRRRE